MYNKLTKEFLDELMLAESIDEALDKDFINNNSLSDYLEILLKEKNLKKNEVIKKSKLNITYGYLIFAGQRQASRDKMLQLIFALQATLVEAQRILKLAGANELYCKIRRDYIIMHCLSNNKSLEETEELLYDYEENLIICDY
jgi:hypothetical protein